MLFSVGEPSPEQLAAPAVEFPLAVATPAAPATAAPAALAMPLKAAAAAFASASCSTATFTGRSAATQLQPGMAPHMLRLLVYTQLAWPLHQPLKWLSPSQLQPGVHVQPDRLGLYWQAVLPVAEPSPVQRSVVG